MEGGYVPRTRSPTLEFCGRPYQDNAMCASSKWVFDMKRKGKPDEPKSPSASLCVNLFFLDNLIEYVSYYLAYSCIQLND